MQFEKGLFEAAMDKANKQIGEPCASHGNISDRAIFIPFYNIFIATCVKCREEMVGGSNGRNTNTGSH